jgi:hypothetical protein
VIKGKSVAQLSREKYFNARQRQMTNIKINIYGDMGGLVRVKEK